MLSVVQDLAIIRTSVSVWRVPVHLWRGEPYSLPTHELDGGRRAFALLMRSLPAKLTIECLSDASLHALELLQWINTLFWHGGQYSLTRSYFDMLIYCGGPLVMLLFLWVILQKSDGTGERSLKIFL